MEVKLAPETATSLKADTSIRFLYREKFRLESRHSVPVIAWAASRAEAVSRAVLTHIGSEEVDSVGIRMLMVRLSSIRNYVLLCFDLWPRGECAEPAQGRRPVHEIAERGGAFVVWRSPKMDARVAAEFAELREFDKGPLPYFVDRMNPPLYDGGKRVERPVDGGESEEKDESVSEEESKSEEEDELEGMESPSPKTEEMTDEQMRGKMEVDRPS